MVLMSVSRGLSVLTRMATEEITYDGKRVFTHRLSFKVVHVTGHDLSAYILVIILHVSILGIFSRNASYKSI